MFSIGVWTDLAENPGFEYALAYTGVENLTVKYILGDYGVSSETKSTLWASYQLCKLLMAAEIADHSSMGNSATEDRDGWLIMANYSITDPLSLTVRYSNTETTGATAANVCDINRFTVSPTYMVTDNFGFLG